MLAALATSVTLTEAVVPSAFPFDASAEGQQPLGLVDLPDTARMVFVVAPGYDAGTCCCAQGGINYASLITPQGSNVVLPFH